VGYKKGPGKFVMEVLESPVEVLDFLVSKRVGTLTVCINVYIVYSSLDWFLSSNRQHYEIDDCLEDNREDY